MVHRHGGKGVLWLLTFGGKQKNGPRQKEKKAGRAGSLSGQRVFVPFWRREPGRDTGIERNTKK